jgi:hypothetical protein
LGSRPYAVGKADEACGAFSSQSGSDDGEQALEQRGKLAGYIAALALCGRAESDKISKPVASILVSADRMEGMSARRVDFKRPRRVLPIGASGSEAAR